MSLPEVCRPEPVQRAYGRPLRVWKAILGQVPKAAKKYRFSPPVATAVRSPAHYFSRARFSIVRQLEPVPVNLLVLFEQRLGAAPIAEVLVFEGFPEEDVGIPWMPVRPEARSLLLEDRGQGNTSAGSSPERALAFDRAVYRAEWICPTFGDVVSPRSGPAPWLTTPYVASLRVPKGMDCSVRCRARRHPWRCDPSPRKRFARLRSNDRAFRVGASASNQLSPRLFMAATVERGAYQKVVTVADGRISG